MANTKRKKTVKRKKKSAANKFFRIVFTTVFLFLVVFIGVSAGYVTIVNNSTEKSNNKRLAEIGQKATDDDKKGESDDGNFLKDLFKDKKTKTNVVIFGVDEDEIRTDVMIVASFDSKTKDINLVSIPRDTRIVLEGSLYQELKLKNSSMGKAIKLNELHAYAGKGHRTEYSIGAIEELMDIDIDYYVKMNFAGFRKVVDAVGGVEVYVPQDMKYEDPTQDLYINLKKGKQTLNGAQAEQLVRFRKGYANGDIGRINTQQDFMKALIKEMLDFDIVKIKNILMVAYEYVETDFGLDDMLKYIKYVNDIKLENVTLKTIPGEAKYIDNRSYFVIDKEQAKKVSDDLFKEQDVSKDGNLEVNEKTKQIDSKDKNTEILNGTTTNGLARAFKNKLESEGFTIKSIDNYTGEKYKKTKIIVRGKNMGQDLQKYFNESEIVVDDRYLPSNIDIRVILGLSEN